MGNASGSRGIPKPVKRDQESLLEQHWTRAQVHACSQALQLESQDVFARLAQRLKHTSLHERYHRGDGQFEKDYTLTQTILGEGVNGHVHLARGRRCGRNFAVKTIDLTSNQAKQGKFLEQLACEVEITLSVNHPHIIRLFDVYQTAKKLHLVMECAEGGELFDRVLAGRISEDDAAKVVWQMLSVTSYLHSEGIVHRDLKLENFLYETKDCSRLKLIDFGFSRHWNGGTPLQGQCGTLLYSAPEAMKRQYIDKTDIWSLGVMTYMILSGRAPFDGTKDQMRYALEAGKYLWRQEHWKGVSFEGADFVKSLLTVDPDERPSANAALKHQWIVARVRHAAIPDIHLDVLRGLKRFQGASKLHKSCLLTMARSMSSADLGEKFLDYFLHMDRTSSGKVKIEHIAEAVNASEGRDNEEIQSALSMLEAEAVFTYSEFLAAIVPGFRKPDTTLLPDAFAHFDHDSVAGVQITFTKFSHMIESVDEPGENEVACPDLAALEVPTERKSQQHRSGKLWRWLERLGEDFDEATRLQAAREATITDSPVKPVHGMPIAPLYIF